MAAGKPLTPLEIYKVLEQSNCRQCMLLSCLAFAAAGVGGQKRLDDCPYLAEEVKKSLAVRLEARSTAEPQQAEFMDKLLRKVETLDLASVAPEIGGSYGNGLLG
ncbi:MAG: (Fe-S)-binding protein, partial [Thermodesulfobacteriota bacterium]